MRHRRFFTFVFGLNLSLLPCVLQATNPLLCDENKENIGPLVVPAPIEVKKTVFPRQQPTATSLSKLEQTVEKIRSKAEKALQSRSAERLKVTYEKFESLKDEEEWKLLSVRRDIGAHTNSLSLKKSIGREIFRPDGLETWADLDSACHRLYRRDTLMSLAISARYQDPISMLYLAMALAKFERGFTPFSDEYHDIVEGLLGAAREGLQGLENHPEIFAVMWQASQAPLFLDSGAQRQTLSALAETSKQKNTAGLGGPEQALLKCEYLHLMDQYYRRRVLPKAPGVEDFLGLGERGYLPAFLKAAEIESDPEKKHAILARASDKNYPLAHLALGRHAWRKKLIEEARAYFLKSGEQGLAEGYLLLGQTYVGDRKFLEDLRNVQSLSEEDVQRGMGYLKLAADHGYPAGCEALVDLHWGMIRILAQESENQDRSDKLYAEKISNHVDQMFNAIEGAMALGSSRACALPRSFFKEFKRGDEWEKWRKHYGPGIDSLAFAKKIHDFVLKKGSLWD